MEMPRIQAHRGVARPSARGGPDGSLEELSKGLRGRSQGPAEQTSWPRATASVRRAALATAATRELFRLSSDSLWPDWPLIVFRDETTGRHHHGLDVGLGDDARRGRDLLDTARRAPRSEGRLRASHARICCSNTPPARRPRPRGHHRRCRRRRASARHDRRQDRAAGARRAGAIQGLSGLDSLLSIVQMPAGIPVATFAIGAAGADQCGVVRRRHRRQQARRRRTRRSMAFRAGADRTPCWPSPIRDSLEHPRTDDHRRARRRPARAHAGAGRLSARAAIFCSSTATRGTPGAQVAPIAVGEFTDASLLAAAGRSAARWSPSTGKTCRSTALDGRCVARRASRRRVRALADRAGPAARESAVRPARASRPRRYAAVDSAAPT